MASVGDEISASSVGGGVGTPALGGGSTSPRGSNKGSARGGGTGTPRGGNTGSARGGSRATSSSMTSRDQRTTNHGTARGGSRATSSSPRAISRPAGSGAPNVGMPPSDNAQPKSIEQAKLPVNLIHDVHQAAIKLGLANSRQTLLGGLDPAIGAQIPTAGSPLEQMLQDLQALNAMGRLRDESFPLRHWLEVALTLTNLRLESQVFEAAIRILSE